ncbi:uncharacterized protein LOC125681694 [Ostrea edulis]|uniref:uncharacterized protein LOC125681694 n=1 Tax=Ostrea edulis TaxID=37623 RepID=UPI0024AF9876|nr:uncharacterized protein LOC125681694 [Ostrea edulis]
MTDQDKKVTPKHTVQTRIVFLKLSDIDTVKEQFAAEVFIESRWPEKSLDHGKENDNLDFSKYWNPKLLVQNVTSATKDKVWKKLEYGKNGEAFIVEKRRIKGIFTENLELQDFPFDLQDLSIVLTSELPLEELEIIEDDEHLSSIIVSCFVDEQEWELREFVESETRTVSKEFTGSKNVVYPFLVFKTLAMRRAGFFVWNIIIIMTIISSLSFATFAVDRDLPQNRLQLAFTLTLTGVTFRFVTNQQLPKISYLTRLDKYILYCMVFNYLVTAWHAIVTLIPDNGTQSDCDLYFFIGFVVFYALFHVFFYAASLKTRTVYIRMVFIRMDNVETLKEQFDGDVYFRARWREPKLDNVKVNQPVNHRDFWNPDLTIRNKVSEKHSETWYEILNVDGEAYLVQKSRQNGTFTEKLELHDFPFDSQDLNICFASSLPTSEVELVEDRDNPSEIGVSCYIHAQEWDLEPYVESEVTLAANEEDYSPALQIRGLASRKYSFFLWNIIIIMTLIGSLPLTTFAINRNNPQRRLLLGFILALTGVAFRFMANQSIPKIPYQTLLDKYLLISMMFNYLVSIWHIIVSRFDDDRDTQSTMDLWAFVATVILYIAYQITFMIIVAIKLFLKKRRIDEKIKIYQKSLQDASKSSEPVKNPIKLHRLQKRQTVAKFSHLILKSSDGKEKSE